MLNVTCQHDTYSWDKRWEGGNQRDNIACICRNIGVLFHFYQSECLCLLCLLCFVYSIEYDILLTIKICSLRVLYSWRSDQTKHIVTVRHWVLCRPAASLTLRAPPDICWYSHSATSNQPSYCFDFYSFISASEQSVVDRVHNTIPSPSFLPINLYRALLLYQPVH